MLFDKDDIVLVTFETFLGVVVVMTLSAHDKIEDKKHINTIWDNLSIYI